MSRAVCLLGLSLAACGHPAAPRRSDVDLATTAEKSAWISTGRYDEVVRLCRDLARVYPASARCDRYGVTPEGRDMVALVVSQDGVLTPDEATRRQRPVILVQAGIHAGEIEGKDATLELLRDMVVLGKHDELLDSVIVLVLPVFSVDAHERRSHYNRINQNGPEMMGWRYTPVGLNLNRDYLKVETPEMRSLISGVYTKWWPHLLIEDRKSTRLNSSHIQKSRMPSSA